MVEQDFLNALVATCECGMKQLEARMTAGTKVCRTLVIFRRMKEWYFNLSHGNTEEHR